VRVCVCVCLFVCVYVCVCVKRSLLSMVKVVITVHLLLSYSSHLEPAHRIAMSIELDTLDMPILDIIVGMCATSPQAHHNQIACTNRRLNVPWRRMHRNLYLAMLQSIADSVHRAPRQPRSSDVLILDVLDIMNPEE
jgi:hypothetical protein